MYEGQSILKLKQKVNTGVSTMTVLNPDFATHKAGKWTVLAPDATSVDYRNADALKTTISAQVSSGNTHLLFNLEQVSFMDSAGLGVLLHAKRTCEAKKGSLALSNVQAYVENLLKLTNLDKTLRSFPTEAEAQASS
jgi:anti-sigma B factor antagonist